jgi:hypothetical protein
MMHTHSNSLALETEGNGVERYNFAAGLNQQRWRWLPHQNSKEKFEKSKKGSVYPTPLPQGGEGDTNLQAAPRRMSQAAQSAMATLHWTI